MLQILQTSHILSDFCAAVFSSVTISLLALNQGNIWFYEDSVLISSRSSGMVTLVFFLHYTKHKTFYLEKRLIGPKIIAAISEDKIPIIYNL